MTVKTFGGDDVIFPQYVPKNSCGRFVTFPIKGTILKKKGKRMVKEYCIWTNMGRKYILKESSDDLSLDSCRLIIEGGVK